MLSCCPVCPSSISSISIVVISVRVLFSEIAPTVAVVVLVIVIWAISEVCDGFPLMGSSSA
jgi:hypothetical protein